MPDQAPDSQAREFAAAFRSFLDWIHSTAADRDNEGSALVRDFLGPDGMHHSVVSRELLPFEHVNLQTAADAWSAAAGRTVEVHGIALPPHYGGLSLQQLIAGEALPPLRLTAPALVDLPNGPESTLGCLRLALLLVTDHSGRYIVMIKGPSEHEPSLQIEVGGLPVGQAQRLLAELDQLRADLNVYRGHLLDVSLNPMGGVVLTFTGPPGITRDDVVLPITVLGRVERHALGVAGHRQALLAAGQHLKRGLLLYGPPGTGKTHTTRYLMGHMTATRAWSLLAAPWSPWAQSPTWPAPCCPRSSCSRMSTWSPRNARSARRRARSCSTCWMPWMEQPPTPTCCFC